MKSQDEMRSDATTRLQASGLLDSIPKWTPPGSPTNWWPASVGPGAEFPESTINGSKEQAQLENDRAIDLYYHMADNVVRSNTAGRKAKTGWPIVPRAAGVQFNGEEYVMVPGIGTPVINALDPPADNTADQFERFNAVPVGTVDIGTAIQAGAQFGLFHLGPNDRTKNGESHEGISADGVQGTFIRIPTAVSQWSGPLAEYGGYYEKVK